MLADDEGIVIESLRFILSKEFGDTCVIESAKTGRSVIELAESFRPDVAVMDIQMPGKNGMETARILRQKNERMVLIFVTAVEEYVFQAFDVAAFHYLVKPFSDEKFEEVVKRAVRSIEKYSENQSDEKYMMVQSGGSHMKVFLKDIVYAEVYNRKVIIHTRDTNIEYYGKLQELSEKGMQFQQDAQQQLDKAYRDMMEPIYKKLQDAVQAVGKAGAYTYVFDLNRTDIPYIDEAQSKDITNDIKTKLGISLTAVPATPVAPAANSAQ